MANRREPSEMPEIANNMHGKIERIASTKTIYIQDIDLWLRAKVMAEAQGISMSELIFAGIQKLVDEKCPVCTRVQEVLTSGSMVIKAKAKK